MANPSLQIGNDNWAIKEDNLLGYSTAGTRFVPQPITMTRASAGTRVNSSGLVETVELFGSELVDNGSFTTDSDWTKGTGWTIANNKASYDGSGTGYQYILQSITTTSGKLYKINFDVLSSTGSNLNIVDFGSVRVNQTHLSAGNYTYYAEADASSENLTIYANGTDTFSIDNVSVKEATIDNLPRVDYTDGTSSLLVEPQRTNTISYSEDFETSGWGTYNSTLETDAVISPNGILNATKLIGTNDVTAHTLYTNAYTVVASVDYTHSVFIKKSQSKYVQLYTGSGFGNYYANFNLEDGIVETFTTLDANIENIGDGWYKCSTKANSSTTTAQSTVALIDTATSGRGYAFNAEDESVYIWGAQVENGSYATSYIPTDGSTVTRVQDQYSKTGISNLINSTEGVLFVEMAATSLSSNFDVISLSNGTTSNVLAIFYYANTKSINVNVIESGFSVFSGFASTITYPPLDFHKIAIKYKTGDFALWIDGTEVLTGSGAMTNLGLSNLQLADGDGTSNKFFGKVKQLQVFKTALTDTELETLTTI